MWQRIAFPLPWIERLSIVAHADRWAEARDAIAASDDLVASKRYKTFAIELRPLPLHLIEVTLHVQTPVSLESLVDADLVEEVQRVGASGSGGVVIAGNPSSDTS